VTHSHSQVIYIDSILSLKNLQSILHWKDEKYKMTKIRERTIYYISHFVQWQM
jgi:hypothetical protein